MTRPASIVELPVEDFRESLVPALGIFGTDAVREAFEGDLNQLKDLLQSAIKTALELSGEEDWWPYVHALFDDFIVVEAKDGKLLKYAYTVNGTDVTLATPEEVQKTFVAVDKKPAGMIEAAGVFIEGNGGAWRIRVIQAGLSRNNNYYPDAVLREAVSLFEGARVFVKSDEEHIAGRGKDFRNLIGGLTDIEFVEGTTPDTGEIRATLQLLDPEGDLAIKLREAHSHGLSSLFGFSIDAAAHATRKTRGGVAVREAKKFTQVRSVDLIVEPGAGGGVIDLIEAQQETKIMEREQLIALLEARGLLKGKNVDEMTDAQLAEMFTEAWNEDADNGGGNTDDLPDGGDVNTGDNTVLTEAVRIVEARTQMRDTINASKLPKAAKDRLIARFVEADSYTADDVTAAIKDEADYLAEFSESGAVRGLGDGPTIQIGETRFDKAVDMLEAFFDPAHEHHRHARSFRECYVTLTGDTRLTGQLRDTDQSLMREALNSGSFADVLGDSITRRMIADYRDQTQYDVWRELATVVSVNDFRTQERTRFGGYGDIPAVAESGDYAALTSPTDEKATYAATKRGGTEKVTLEMITNDDVGAIRRIPTKLSRAAKRTLSKFVLNQLATNPIIFDGVALFHATHGNLGAAALSGTSVAAGRLAMKEQTEKDSNEKLSVPAKNLWVPDTLEETAVDLFRRNTENDKTFVQSLALQVIPVWCWTDANDWVMTADKMDVPMFELGFLNGQEEPELFVQDSPSVGSMFTNDEMTWKLRHIYGGNFTDYRGGYKAVVV